MLRLRWLCRAELAYVGHRHYHFISFSRSIALRGLLLRPGFHSAADNTVIITGAAQADLSDLH